MTPNIKPLVAGNWKMNGTSSSLAELSAVASGFDASLQSKVDTLLCVPATLLDRAANAATGGLAVGAQDCHFNSSGAHTGDISAEMILDSGGSYTIVGHSERRMDHGETSETVKAKAEAASVIGLNAIVCIGELEEERRSGTTLQVLKDQLDESLPSADHVGKLIIAYEPVWAIGTGLVPSAGDVEEAHAFIRDELVRNYGEAGSAVHILYGGSVKPANAVELMAINNVDGALVGGASLKAQDFLGICNAYLQI